MATIPIDITPRKRYRYRGNLTIWTQIESAYAEGQGYVILQSRGGAYRYPTLADLAVDWVEYTSEL